MTGPEEGGAGTAGGEGTVPPPPQRPPYEPPTAPGYGAPPSAAREWAQSSPQQTPTQAPSPPPARPVTPPRYAEVPPRQDPLPSPRPVGGATTPRANPLPPRGPRTDVPRAGASTPSAPSRGRRARLTLRRIDPWSVFLYSVVASIFLGVALLVAVAVLFGVLSSLGVTETLNTLIGDVTSEPGQPATPSTFFSSGNILGFAAVIAAVDVVLLTAFATLSAFLYNLCAQLTGGIEVTLGDRE